MGAVEKDSEGARRVKLTKRSVERLQYDGDGENPIRISDTEIRGLSLRIYPSGRKKFWLRYRVGGRRRELALGDFGPLTPEQARNMALEKLGLVVQGEDPLAEQQETEQRGTVRDLAQAYLERHAKPNKRSWQTDESRLTKYVLPALGDLRPSSVRRQDIERLCHQIGVKQGKPYESNRVLALVRVMLNKGEAWGFLPEGHPNPCRNIEFFAEKIRDRTLTNPEIGRLPAAIATEDDPYVRAAIWLYLLSGLRKVELLRLRRGDVLDWERGLVLIRESKARRKGPDVRPLGQTARSVLQALTQVEGNEYYFPSSRSECGHLVNISKAWKRVRERAGLEDVTIHDLRRTVGSQMATEGESMKVIAVVLGHASTRITEDHYAHMAPSPAQEAADRYGKHIVAVAGVEPADAVLGVSAEKD